MAIDPNLVSIIPASELPTGVPTSAGQFFFYEGDKMMKAPMTEIYELVSGSQSLGTITPSSTIPAEGNIWGFAGEGTYPNAGDITVSPNTLGILTRVDDVWSKVEVEVVIDAIQDGSVTPEKTSFFVSGVNMVNPDKTIQGKAVNEVTGGLFDNTSYQSHTDIKVKPNTNYYFNINGRHAWYDSGGNYISGAINTPYTDVILQSPSNASSISFTSVSGDSVIMAESDTPVDFVPYELVLNSELLPEIPLNIPDGSIAEEKVTFVKKNYSQMNQYLFGSGNWGSLLTSTTNVAIGYEAMANNISSSGNVVIGTRAAKNQKSENGNIVIGADAAMNAETICDCAYIGWEAGLNVKGGVGDTGMGRRSLARAQWAGNNTGYGDSTLFRTVATENGNTGYANIAIGYVAMEYGMKNTATIGIGRGTGRLINSTDNVLIGDAVYYGSESSISFADREGDTVDVPWAANSVTAIGTKAMNEANNGANETTAVGKMSLLKVSSIRNTAVGAFSGTNVTTGGGNTLIGYNANTSTGGITNSIAIGYMVTATKSNQVVIGSVNNDEFVICGVTFTKAQLQALKNLV